MDSSQRLVLSRLISGLGDAASIGALSVAVLHDFGGGHLSVLLFSVGMPYILLIPLGGLVADTWDRKSVLARSYVFAGICQALIAACILKGDLDFWLILALSTARVSASAIASPAASSAFFVAARMNERPESVAASWSLASNVATVGGPAVAALFLQFGSPGLVLVLDSASFFASATIVFGTTIPSLKCADVDKRSSHHASQMRSGFSYVSSLPWLAAIIVSSAAMQATLMPCMSFVAAVQLESVDMAWLFPLLRAANGAGGIIGTLATRQVSVERPLLAGFLGLATLCGWSPLLLALAPSVASIILIAEFCAGFAIGLFGVQETRSIMRHVEGDYLGRVDAVNKFGSASVRPFATLGMAPLVNLFGTKTVLLLTTFCVASAALTPLMMKSVRGLRVK
ncbi:MFS transporter [Dermacoccus nishinomiyaensis]|uniref:MFS transporter n=1 Tax=Dermacoccus nishinomiyaensis TaxID=1274 RepID=UPI001481E304|nr:MFS transporter [Dermacoccus nishinomiyaensis]